MKKMIFLLVLVIFVSVAILALMGQSVVVYRQEAPAGNYDFEEGQKVNPLRDFNFDEGNWTAFVVFSRDDRPHLPASISNFKVIRCDDKVVLKELQDQLEFDYTDGDMTTVASKILIFKNDRLMFDSGLVVESGMEGFQSRDFGWIENNNPGSLAKILSKFKRTWSPLMIL